MKRTILVWVLLLGSALAVSASYKVYLVSGETVIADEKPVVKDGVAYFAKGGLTYSLSPSRIDFEKSEKNALAEAAAPHIEQVNAAALNARASKPQTVRKVDDQTLDEIRSRARLANEDELAPSGGDASAPPPSPEGKAEGRGDGANKALQNRAQAQQRVAELESNLAQAESNRNQARSTLDSLKAQFDNSVQQDERTALAAQVDAAQASLDSANSQVNDASAQVRAAQNAVNNTPVVIELPKQDK